MIDLLYPPSSNSRMKMKMNTSFTNVQDHGVHNYKPDFPWHVPSGTDTTLLSDSALSHIVLVLPMWEEGMAFYDINTDFL